MMDVRRILRLLIIGCSVLMIYPQEGSGQAPQQPPGGQPPQPPQQQPGAAATQPAAAPQQQQAQQPPQQPTAGQSQQPVTQATQPAPAAGASAPAQQPQQQQQQQQQQQPAGVQQTPPVPPPPPSRERTSDLSNPPVVPTPGPSARQNLKQEHEATTTQPHGQQQAAHGAQTPHHGVSARPAQQHEAHHLERTTNHPHPRRRTTPASPSLVVRPLNHTFYPRRKGHGFRKHHPDYKHPNGDYYHLRNRQNQQQEQKKPDGPYIPHPTFDNVGYQSLLKNILFRLSRLERILFFEASRNPHSKLRNNTDTDGGHGAGGPKKHKGESPQEKKTQASTKPVHTGSVLQDNLNAQEASQEITRDKQQQDTAPKPAVQVNAKGPTHIPDSLMHDLMRDVISDMQASQLTGDAAAAKKKSIIDGLKFLSTRLRSAFRDRQVDPAGRAAPETQGRQRRSDMLL